MSEMIEGYRLSPQQKYLWSLQQDDRNLSYKTQCAISIEGDLNASILESALQKVVDRNEILRTSFHCLPGMTIPLQVINEYSIAIASPDLSNLDRYQQQDKIEALFEEARRSPLNFDQDILLHFCLIKISPTQHLLLISLPTLCADRITMGNLVGEIGNTYDKCLRGEEFSEEPIQYADIAEWQNELIEERDTASPYWDNYNSEPIDLKLPLENKIADNSSFQLQVIAEIIDSNLRTKLQVIAQQYETSIGTFLLSCWLILLSRLTGESTLIIGTEFNGRNYEELEPALGLFAKYLPLRCHCEGNLKFGELLEQVNISVNEASKWQDYFVGLTEKPVIGFDFAEDFGKISIDNLQFLIYQQFSSSDRFKLKLSCLQKENYLITEFYYNANLFSASAIQRVSDYFQVLLAGIAKEPNAAIASYNILGDRERQQLLVEFNQTQIDYAEIKCIHKLFEEQAELNPDRLAVIFEDNSLTYRELNARANQLAHSLQNLGIVPDKLVGIYLERSHQIILAILGILKAGGAYIPLDPVLPAEALNLRLEDSNVSVILTQKQLLEKIPKSATNVLCLDADWEEIASNSQDNPTSNLTPENLAYVLFTSGSTGKPKGVAVEHQQLFNYINAIIARLDLSVCNSFATVSTFAADLGNTVIFSSLCQGKSLHIISGDRAANPDAFGNYIHNHSIDCIKIVPAHVQALLTSEYPERILPQKRLILGGEACSWNLIDRLQQLETECQIFNHYGPTETTVGVLTYPITNNHFNTTTVPIGRPIANTQIYLLDSYLQPVPLGVPGELYIGGAGVARGYLNQLELTRDKFIPNPFNNAKNADYFLYQTGDIARYLPDGNLEFIGRIDNQVKIHGYRIELGEIEAALRSHPAIRDTIIIAREDRLNNKQLIAYVVIDPTQTIPINDLQIFLQQRLPDYAIPATFVPLKALPLNPNGKVNRSALPEPNSGINAENFVAPRTPNEKVLAKIWMQVLELPQIGIHDDFFKLGGDSIISMQVVAKANQAGLQLTPKQVFDHQTIAELAAVAGKATSVEAEQGMVTGEVSFTPIQSWFFEQNFPEPHHWNQSFMIEVPPTLNPTLLEKTVQHLLEHHDALRLRFLQKEWGWQQFNANLNGVESITKLDLSALSPDKQSAAVEEVAAELQTTLNLSSGPLIRVALFNLGKNQTQRLLLIIHHLAVDGVSWRILLSDMETVYQQLARNEEIQLPPKTISFKHWTQRLEEYAQSAELERELDYWLTEHNRAIASVPVDFVGGSNTVADTETVAIALNRQETKALLQEVPAIYQTQINELLIAALVQAFAKHYHSLDKLSKDEEYLLIDLEGHGREQIFDDDVNLSRTVGWFSTIFPVVITLEKAAETVEILKAVQQQLRRLPNRGIGYGVLRYLSSHKQQLQSLPQAEIRFNYLGQTDYILSESSLFKPARESRGARKCLRGNQNYLLDIVGIVQNSQLQINWMYGNQIYRRSTIENLANNYREALQKLAGIQMPN